MAEEDFFNIERWSDSHHNPSRIPSTNGTQGHFT